MLSEKDFTQSLARKRALITVLITTHNYGHFIEHAIDSVLSQDFPLEQVQILVVDDGSIDDTRDRVKKYGSRVEYFYKPNGGQASALNFGFAHARGEIIALLDADDLFLPGKLARIVEAFQQDPALGMVYHRLREWHTQTDERRDWPFPPVSGDVHRMPEQFLEYAPQPTSAVSFRRTSLGLLVPIPEEIRMLADCFLVALIPILSPILAIPEFLALYRIHGSNSYSSDEPQVSIEVRERRIQQWQILIAAICKWLACNGYPRKQPPVGSLLDRWTLYMESERFVLKPPGRLRFFRHLVTYNRCYRPGMSRRLRAINYINALGSLVTGYKHFHLLDKSRLDCTTFIQRMVKRPAVPRAEK